MRTLARMLVSAFAFWLTTLVVGGAGPRGIWVEAYGAAGSTSLAQASADDEAVGSYIVTLLLVALLFGVVNGTVGRLLRIVSLPLRILTLGLFGIIINGFLLIIVAWISELAGFGLHVGGFWWGVLAAIVMSVLTALMNGLLGTSKRADR